MITSSLPFNDSVTLKQRIGVYFLSAAMVLQPTLGWAADPVAANGNTTVYKAENGVAVVDIARANAAGLSHNQFNSYNVDTRGLVLNNGNSDELLRQSQLAGQVAANLNLANQARVILNEVVSPNRSQLNGYTEVLGGAADVIVANPYGISCNGCGFINTPNVTLTTGVPQLDNSGALNGFQVNSGDIVIGGNGINASSADVLSLVTPALKLQGQVNAKELNVSVGKHSWNYLTREASDAVDSGESFGLDSTALGGMYANRIRIQASGAGVGVKMLGDAAASAGEFTINAQGQVVLKNQVSAQDSITINTTSSASNALQVTDGSISTKDDLNLAATGGVELVGGALVAKNIDINAASLSDTTSVASLADNNKRHADTITVSSDGEVSLTGTSWSSTDDLSVNADTLELDSASVASNGTMSLSTAGDMNLGQSSVSSTGDMSLVSEGSVSTQVGANQGVQSTNGNISINAATGVDNQGVVTAESGDVLVRADGVINNSGTLHAKQALDVADRNNGTTAQISNSGNLLSDGSLSAKGQNITNTGMVQAETQLGLEAVGDINNDGTILSTGTLSAKADSITNPGTVQAATQLMATANNISNSGSIWSDDELTVNAVNIIINSGAVIRGNTVNMDVTQLLRIEDNGALNSQGDTTLNIQQLLFGGDKSRIVTAISGGMANIHLASVFNNLGAIHSGGDLNLRLPALTNTNTGGISALGALSINATAGDIFNAGAFYAGQQLNASTTGTLTNHATNAGFVGTIDSSGSIAMSADTFVNHSRIDAAQDITVSADVFRNEIPFSTSVVWGGFTPTTTELTKHRGKSYIYGCCDHYEEWEYRQTKSRKQAYVGGKPSFTPQLIGGGTVTIRDFSDAQNVGAVISGGAVNLWGKSGSVFTNNSLPIYSEKEIRDYKRQTRWKLLGPLTHHTRKIVRDSGFVKQSPVLIDRLNAGIFSNSKLDVKGTSLKTKDSIVNDDNGAKNSSVDQLQTPSASVGSAASAINFAGLNLNLPSNPNGYFVPNQDPSSQYLVETNPLFSIGSNYLGSDYLTERLGYNPDEVQRRLGDAAYENHLIQQQVIEQTGRNILAGYASEAAQVKSFLDAASEQFSDLNLELGKELNSTQISQLQSDIVWMVEKEVAGERVLVPVVYLSQASIDGVTSGAVIAAVDISMDLESLTNTGGTIVAENDMAIISEGDITNTGGSIQAEDMILASTDGKIINETLVTRVGSADNYQDVAGTTGSISANNSLVLSADQGIDIIGATVDAGGSATLHSENGDVTIESLALESKSTSHEYSSGLFNSSQKTTVETNQTALNAGVSAGGNLNIVAEKGDVDLLGAELSSGEDLNIAGINVNSTALNLVSTKTVSETTSGITASGIGTASSSSSSYSSTGQGSTITAGNVMSINASNDIVLEGGEYNATAGVLNAGNNVTTSATKDVSNESSSSSFAGLGANGIGAESQSTITNSTTHKNADLTFGDSLTITAGNTVDIGGMDATITNRAEPEPNVPPVDEAAAESGAPETEFVEATPEEVDPVEALVPGFDVEQLREAMAGGDVASYTEVVADNGMGFSDSFAQPDENAVVGSLNINANKVVSTKFKDTTYTAESSSSTNVGFFSVDVNSATSEHATTADNINTLSAANVSINGTDAIDLKGVDIKADDLIHLKSEGDITITAAEKQETFSATSHSTHVGFDGINVSSSSVEGMNKGHDNSKLSTDGLFSIESGGDVIFTGVTAEADTLGIQAENFIGAAYKDESTLKESSDTFALGFSGVGQESKTLDIAATQEVGNTIIANNALIDVKDNVTIVGGDVIANNLAINAHTVDIVAAESTWDEKKTQSGFALTASGNAAFLGNRATASASSMGSAGSALGDTGKGFSGLADQVNSAANVEPEAQVTSDVIAATSGNDTEGEDNASHNGKAATGELVNAKVGLTISSSEETINSTTYQNANLSFGNLTINTVGNSEKGDGHVDIGGANLVSLEGIEDSSITINTGELKTTKYVDDTKTTFKENTTFIGHSSEVHSAAADAANNTDALVDKANDGMELDPGLVAAQAGADASNLVMGDLAGGTTGLEVSNTNTEMSSHSTSENTNYISAANISITTTEGNIDLKGVQFTAPPVFNEETGEMQASIRPQAQSISLDSAQDVNLTAAKSTHSETSTSTTHTVNASLYASGSAMGSSVGADFGYNGNTETTKLDSTSYANAQLTADNVSIKGENLNLTGANVGGDSVAIDIENDINVTSVQDTQTKTTTRSNWGGSLGVSVGSYGLAPSVNGQGGGGESRDNFAKTGQQSGIQAENNLAIAAGGDLTLTGAHIGVAEGGSGTVDIKGDVVANQLNDVHDKSGGFYGGGGGFDAGGVNVNVDIEVVDKIDQKITQNSTITGVDLTVGGELKGDNLTADGVLQEEQTTMITDRRIAGVHIVGSGFAPTPKGARPTLERAARKIIPLSKEKTDQIVAKYTKMENSVVAVRKKMTDPINKAVINPVKNVVKKTVINPVNKTVVDPLKNTLKKKITDPINKAVLEPVKNTVKKVITDPVKNAGNKIAQVLIPSKKDTNESVDKHKTETDSVVVVVPKKIDGEKQDQVAQNAAAALIKKNEEQGRNVVLVEADSNGNTTVLKGDLSQVKGNTKVEVLSHGDQLKGQEKNIANVIKTIDANTPRSEISRVNVDACTDCSATGEKTFGDGLTEQLTKQNMQPLEVASYSPGTKVHIDGFGNKHVKNDSGDVISVVRKTEKDGVTKKPGEKLIQSKFEDAVALVHGQEGANKKQKLINGDDSDNIEIAHPVVIQTLSSTSQPLSLPKNFDLAMGPHLAVVARLKGKKATTNNMAVDAIGVFKPTQQARIVEEGYPQLNTKAKSVGATLNENLKNMPVNDVLVATKRLTKLTEKLEEMGASEGILPPLHGVEVENFVLNFATNDHKNNERAYRKLVDKSDEVISTATTLAIFESINGLPAEQTKMVGTTIRFLSSLRQPTKNVQARVDVNGTLEGVVHPTDPESTPDGKDGNPSEHIYADKIRAGIFLNTVDSLIASGTPADQAIMLGSVKAMQFTLANMEFAYTAKNVESSLHDKAHQEEQTRQREVMKDQIDEILALFGVEKPTATQAVNDPHYYDPKKHLERTHSDKRIDTTEKTSLETTSLKGKKALGLSDCLPICGKSQLEIQSATPEYQVKGSAKPLAQTEAVLAHRSSTAKEVIQSGEMSRHSNKDGHSTFLVEHGTTGSDGQAIANATKGRYERYLKKSDQYEAGDSPATFFFKREKYKNKENHSKYNDLNQEILVKGKMPLDDGLMGVQVQNEAELSWLIPSLVDKGLTPNIRIGEEGQWYSFDSFLKESSDDVKSVVIVMPSTKRGGQQDQVAQDAARALIKKNREQGRKVVLVESDSKGNIKYPEGELENLSGKTKVEVVSHGGQLKGQAESIATAIQAVNEKTSSDAVIKRVNVDACTTCSAQDGREFAADLTDQLSGKVGNELEVASYSEKTKLHITENGEKQVENVKGGEVLSIVRTTKPSQANTETVLQSSNLKKKKTLDDEDEEGFFTSLAATIKKAVLGDEEETVNASTPKKPVVKNDKRNSMEHIAAQEVKLKDAEAELKTAEAENNPRKIYQANQKVTASRKDLQQLTKSRKKFNQAKKVISNGRQNEAFNKVKTVYRSDDRTPAEILAAQGFKPRDKDAVEHRQTVKEVYGNKGDAKAKMSDWISNPGKYRTGKEPHFVATSRDQDTSGQSADYVYQIDIEAMKLAESSVKLSKANKKHRKEDLYPELVMNDKNVDSADIMAMAPKKGTREITFISGIPAQYITGYKKKGDKGPFKPLKDFVANVEDNKTETPLETTKLGDDKSGLGCMSGPCGSKAIQKQIDAERRAQMEQPEYRLRPNSPPLVMNEAALGHRTSYTKEIVEKGGVSDSNNKDGHSTFLVQGGITNADGKTNAKADLIYKKYWAKPDQKPAGESQSTLFFKKTHYKDRIKQEYGNEVRTGKRPMALDDGGLLGIQVKSERDLNWLIPALVEKGLKPNIRVGEKDGEGSWHRFEDYLRPSSSNAENVVVVVPKAIGGGEQDQVAQDAASALIKKNKEQGRKVVLVEADAQGNITYPDGSLANLSGNTKVEVVSHGDQLKGQAERMATAIAAINNQTTADTVIQRVNVDACTICSAQDGREFAADLTEQLTAKIENTIEVASYSENTKLHITADGEKQVENIGKGGVSSVVRTTHEGEGGLETALNSSNLNNKSTLDFSSSLKETADAIQTRLLDTGTDDNARRRLTLTVKAAHAISAAFNGVSKSLNVPNYNTNRPVELSQLGESMKQRRISIAGDIQVPDKKASYKVDSTITEKESLIVNNLVSKMTEKLNLSREEALEKAVKKATDSVMLSASHQTHQLQSFLKLIDFIERVDTTAEGQALLDTPHDVELKSEEIKEKKKKDKNYKDPFNKYSHYITGASTPREAIEQVFKNIEKILDPKKSPTDDEQMIAMRSIAELETLLGRTFRDEWMQLSNVDNALTIMNEIDSKIKEIDTSKEEGIKKKEGIEKAKVTFLKKFNSALGQSNLKIGELKNQLEEHRNKHGIINPEILEALNSASEELYNSTFELNISVRYPPMMQADLGHHTGTKPSNGGLGLSTDNSININAPRSEHGVSQTGWNTEKFLDVVLNASPEEQKTYAVSQASAWMDGKAADGKYAPSEKGKDQHHELIEILATYADAALNGQGWMNNYEQIGVHITEAKNSVENSQAYQDEIKDLDEATDSTEIKRIKEMHIAEAIKTALSEQPYLTAAANTLLRTVIDSGLKFNEASGKLEENPRMPGNKLENRELALN